MIPSLIARAFPKYDLLRRARPALNRSSVKLVHAFIHSSLRFSAGLTDIRLETSETIRSSDLLTTTEVHSCEVGVPFVKRTRPRRLWWASSWIVWALGEH